MSENHQAAWPAVLEFDGHNDLLCRLWQHHRADAVNAFLQGTASGQLDFPRLRQGKMAGGIFAVWGPSHPTVAATMMEDAARNSPNPP
nr:Membrane dipeptidase (Peptidase family M19) [Candidatus Pantoea persica]